MIRSWGGMPDFTQEKKVEFKKIKVIFIDGSYIFVRFNSQLDYEKYTYRKLKFNFSAVSAQRSLFSDVTEQQITDKTKSIWFPFKSHWGLDKKAWVSNEEMKPDIQSI